MYDFNAKFQRINVAEFQDSCIISIEIEDKTTTRKLQIITMTSNYLWDGCFTNCNSVRSFTTKKNLDSKIIDNDYGDIIVADFNFDGKEDIAIKNSSGGNGGPTYNYYIQNDRQHFDLSNFLTQKMQFFPFEIDNENCTLTIHVHANALQYRSTSYKYNLNSHKWKTISSKLVNA